MQLRKWTQFWLALLMVLSTWRGYEDEVKCGEPIYLCQPSPTSLPTGSHLFHSSFWQFAQANHPNFFQELFSQIECDVELIMPVRGRKDFHGWGPSPTWYHKDSSAIHSCFPCLKGVCVLSSAFHSWSWTLILELKIAFQCSMAFLILCRELSRSLSIHSSLVVSSYLFLKPFFPPHLS